MTIILKNYNSKFFPVMATWKIGSVDYSGVFTDANEAINYLIGRFGRVEIIDKTK